MIQPEPKGSTQGYPLDSVEVLRTSQSRHHDKSESYNQKEVDELKAKQIAKNQDPLALMANSNNPYVFLSPHQDQSSFNQNYLQQPMPNPKDIPDPITAMNMELVLMAKAFKLNYSTPTNNNQRISSNPKNRKIAQPGMNMGQDRQMQMVGVNGGNQFRVQNVGNQNGLIGVKWNGNQNQIGNGHYARNCTVRPKRRDAAYLQTQVLTTQKEEAGIQLQAEEYDLMAAAADLDEIKENDNDVISEDTSVEQGGETVEQHPANLEETRASYESLYHNLAIEVEKINSINRKLKETNADLTTELARYKNQERMTIETHKWSSSAHQELHKIVRDEIFTIVNQVDTRVQNFEIQFLKEAAKFVGDFKSLANEADASLAKHKALELKIERLLKAVVSHDIMIIMQNEYVKQGRAYTEGEHLQIRHYFYFASITKLLVTPPKLCRSENMSGGVTS
nr:hypothetical protein [Tanacetum cinerariifolium]